MVGKSVSLYIILKLFVFKMECKYKEFLLYDKPKGAKFVKNRIKTSILGLYQAKSSTFDPLNLSKRWQKGQVPERKCRAAP
jgi:hypothetical protein